MNRTFSKLAVRLASLFLASAALVFWLPACGSETKPDGGTPKAGEAKEGDHKEGEAEGDGHEEGDHSECDHGEEGEQGREWVIDIGEHTYLGQMDFDAEHGDLSVTVVDHQERQPYPHKIEKALLNIVLASGSKQIEMKADPGDDNLIGETFRYKVTDEALKGLKELKGRLNLTIDGKEYLCDLKAAH
jgi:hypothetical protein